MSRIVPTSLGRFRRVNTGNPEQPDTWLFECPGCGEWAYLDDDQWNGRVSVDHASMGCPGGYHETHDYATELLVTVRARVTMESLTGTPRWEEDAKDLVRVGLDLLDLVERAKPMLEYMQRERDLDDGEDVSLAQWLRDVEGEGRIPPYPSRSTARSDRNAE